MVEPHAAADQLRGRAVASAVAEDLVALRDLLALELQDPRRRGTRRIALLSGRGEPEAERAEEAVRASGAELTILRSTWFMQNFSEDYMLDHVLSGEIRLPAGDVPTPFLDVDDIADVAVAALTDDRHAGRLYELTGPHSLTFADAAAVISAATGREVRYVPVTIEEHAAELLEHGVSPEVVELLTYLFGEVVDGRNASTADGVEQALGRRVVTRLIEDRS